jgi:hypothetical protein
VQFQRTLYTASLSTLFVAPALLLVPPRKLDLYTFSLCGAFVVAANHQTKSRTGDGILVWLGGKRARFGRVDGSGEGGSVLGSGAELGEDGDVRRHTTPVAASVTGSMLQGTQRQGAKSGLNAWDPWSRQEGALLGADGKVRAGEGVLGTLRYRTTQKISVEHAAKSREEKDERGVAKKIWLGDQEEDWREQRMREEREAAEKGKSTQEVILDQVWSVWNWGAESKEEGKRKWEESRKG